MRWPIGVAGPPREIDALTHGTDLLPTLIELCHLPGARPGAFDGLSLCPLLAGQSGAFDQRKLVVQYGAEFKEWDSTVLWGKWRLVKGTELYDLASDPGQGNDVAATRPDIVSALRAHYQSQLGPTKAVMGRPISSWSVHR